MKKVILLAVALSSFAQAAPTVRTWTNPECASGSCELKGMKLFLEKENFQYAGTTMAAEIETSDKESLSKYAVVQYIEGCVFETNIEGQIKMGQREFWGVRGRTFKHVGYELDSAGDRDPLYWSNPNSGFDELRGFFVPRNSYYATANPILTENYGAWAGKTKNLKENKIFVSDYPTPSNSSTDTNLKVVARNSSLRFKICLHKIEDVPAKVDSPATEIPGALVCMTWDSNFIYNFATRKFVDRGQSVHPACK